MKKEYKVDLERESVAKKAGDVKDTIAEMKSYTTVALLDLNRLPDSLLQKLRKKIREDGGKVRILKKPVITRVLQSNQKLKDKAALCDRPVALVLTNWSPYALNSFFKQNKKRRAAKVDEVAPYDIIVPEGETDLPPGPALSELKTGGVNVQIKAGKIVVAKDSLVAKAGEKMTVPKVKALQTLNVKPFEIKANLLLAFDGEYSYPSELLDLGDTLHGDLVASYADGMNLSLNAAYPTEANSKLLLVEAIRQSVNVALNSGVYSSGSVELLLTSALRQGMALSGLKAEGDAGGSDAPTA